MEYKWKKGVVNIGWEVKKVMQARGMLVKELAGLVGIHPSAMREIMERLEIGTERLKQLSEVLGVNFFECYVEREDYSEELERLKKVEEELASLKIKNGELERENQLLKDVIELLKRK